MTPQIRDTIGRLLPGAISALVRDIVNERLSSALNASAVPDEASEAPPAPEDVQTTQEELSGFHIVQAIASRVTSPRRVVMRDAKSYCAILLDDNNRKTLVRLHFNAATSKYLGTFSGKDETRHLLSDLTDIYQHTQLIEQRIRELDGEG